LSQFKNYHLSGNLKFNNLGLFQSLKFGILMKKKILPSSHKLNVTQNTLGCFGLSQFYSRALEKLAFMMSH